MNGAAEKPVIGLFGAFDTGELGEVALRRVIESELLRRRPDIELVAMAPLGAEHPIPGDEGRPARPLAPEATGTPLSLDALIIAGDVLGDDKHWAARYPVPVDVISGRGVQGLALTGKRNGRAVAPAVLWFAVGAPAGDLDAIELHGQNVWARNLAAEERLGGTAVQSGDPLLLAGRIFTPDVLRTAQGLAPALRRRPGRDAARYRNRTESGFRGRSRRARRRRCRSAPLRSQALRGGRDPRPDPARP